MASSSTLDPDNIPSHGKPKTAKGHGVRSLGPSETSDNGSDIIGRADDDTAGEPDLDRVVYEKEAGLGGGLDQAEEARAGKTRYGAKPRKRRRGRAFSIKRG